MSSVIPLFDQSPLYSKTLIRTYDKERHILLNDAYNLIESQQDPNLPVSRLREAVESGSIHVYDLSKASFTPMGDAESPEKEGMYFLDRLDIGRVYHQPKKEKRGLTIERYFTDGETRPEDTIGELKKRHLDIIERKTQKVKWEMDAYFPDSWDDNSASIVASKYFFNPKAENWRKKLEEKIGSPHENSIVHLAKRVTNFFADEGNKLGYFASDEDREAFRDELLWLQLHRKAAFNSPVQFNAGIFNEYEIKGSYGLNYYRNAETGEVTRIIDGEYKHPQCHACFIKGPRDDLESIAQHSIDEIGVFAAGSGIGQDIGALRAEGEKLSGGGKASGPMSFFRIYDTVAGAIKSGGKSRRAARMTIMQQHHPDIEKFIKSKVEEDHKALILMRNGYSGGMDGEAYTTISYQNTNISVRLDDYFFKQLENGGSVQLMNVTDGKIVGEIPADKLLKEISFGSWRIGDPAIQYESKIQEMNTVKNSGRVKASNPCAEYLHLDDTSCNLASQNLLSFTDNVGNFDVESYKRSLRIFAIAQDIANDAASYPVRDIAEISPELRTIGQGFANLGGLLMRRGVPYDSEKGRALAGALSAILTGVTYEVSTELAENLGSFTHFEFNKKPMTEVMKKHQGSLEDIAWEHVPNELRTAAENSWKRVVERTQIYGHRNAQATVIAPTGTISYYMASEDSTGGEPNISLIIYKNLAGGGTLKLVNKEAANALNNLGYSDEQVKDIINYVSEEPTPGIPRGTVIGSPHLSPEHYRIFDASYGSPTGEGSISLEGHVRMMGVIQPFISGGISKTNNIPESATVKDAYDGFVLAHKLGVKGITIFRNNGKPISVFDFGGQKHVELKRGEKEDLPNRRLSFENEIKIDGRPFHVIVSEYEDGRPGQITFLSYKSGSTLGALLTTSGVQASRALKRGLHLEDVADGWIGHQFEPSGLVQGHPYIKTALSPLDFAGKFLKLEYLGDVDVANDPENVDIEKLRGFQNGAILTYERMKIDDWDIDQVLDDPILGGFKEKTGKLKKFSIEKKSGSKKNSRGVPCPSCGNIMIQTSSNCYECGKCAEKIGGCGI